MIILKVMINNWLECSNLGISIKKKMINELQRHIKIENIEMYTIILYQ